MIQLIRKLGSQLALLMLGGVLMLIIRVVLLSPAEPIVPQPAKMAGRPITLAEVAEKSKDAFNTTAAYLQQEKHSMQSRMSVLQAKLDKEITRLRAEAEQADKLHKQELSGKIIDLQDAKTRLLGMQGQIDQKVGKTTHSAWEKLKQNYNRMELDLNARIPPEDQPPQPASTEKPRH